MADFKGLRYYFIVFLSLFSFPFALLLVEAVPLPPDAFYANFRGSSLEHDADFV